MSGSWSKQQVLILDCCYSGAFAKGMVMKSDSTVGVKDSFDGKGLVILTASNSIQYAFIDEQDNIQGEGQHSIFTEKIIGGLEVEQL